jgi:hypothetical protein
MVDYVRVCTGFGGSPSFRQSFPGNHCIRSIDLQSGQVYLLAGVPKLPSSYTDLIIDIPGYSFPDGLSAKLKGFDSPIGIDIQTNGNMYDIYVADSSGVRKLSISESEIAENSASLRLVPKIPMSCTPLGLASSPDGQWAIVSCPEVGEIYKIDFSKDETVRIAGNSETSEAKGYSNGIGSLATFRYPQGVIVSPDGAFALIAE